MVSVSARLTAKRNRSTITKCSLLLAAIALAVWPAGVRAQYFPANSVPDTFNDQSTSGVVLLGRPKGLLGPYADTGYFGPYLHLQHTAGDGPGYRDNGFTSLGLFAPKKAWNGMLFFDGRLSVNDFGNMIGNAGGGYRYFSPNQNRVYGGSIWYDIDAGHRSTFSQGGASLETRGEDWDFFLNGYFPWGDETKEFNRIVTPTGNSTIGFTGNFLAINRPNLITRQLELAMTGFDAELGGPLPVVGKYGIRGYGGYYHYGADNITDINGGRFRLQAELTDSLSGQFLLTNDSQFDTSVIFTVTWSLPGSGASRSEYTRPGFNRSGRAAVVRGQTPPGGRRTISQYYRMFQPTQRSQRVFVANTNTREIEDNLTILTDPVTGQPIVIFHMDSRAAAGGDGSFATPFANPQEAQAGTGPGDTIFTHAGSVFNNPANNFIALQENQQLLGEGVPYFVNTDQLGLIPIPASGDAGGFPTIQGGGGMAAVTMANGSRLSGFAINNSAVAGVRADAGLTMGNSALVENTTINGGPFGLNVMNLGGTINFAATSSINNTTTAALNVAGAMTTGTVNVDGTINNSMGQAIDVNNLPAGGVVNVNGMVTDVGGGGGGVGSINVRNSAGNVTIANANLTIPAGDGVTLIDNPLATIRFGQLDVNAAAGNAFVGRNSGNLFVAGGNLTSTGGQAIFLDDNGTMAPFTVNMQLNDVSSTNSALLNMAGITVDRVSGTLSIGGTATVAGPMGNGIEFIDSSADISIATVDIDNTTGAGIFLQDNSGVMPDLLTGSLIVNGGSIDGSMGPSFQVMNGSATSLYQGDINHTVGVAEMVRIEGTSAAANNQFNTGILTATAGSGILIRDADGNASFLGTTNITGTTRGVLIDMDSTGSFIWGTGATITDTMGNAFEINGSSPTSTYSGDINQSLAFRAVEINNLQAGGTATFNSGTINATAASTGFRIFESQGNVTVENYVAGVRLPAPGARLMNTALEINNSSGVHQFENLDLFTAGGNGILITANPGVQGTFGVTTGRVDTMGESAIDITDTNITAVNLTEVAARATAGNHGVTLNNLVGGTFTISDGDDMTMMDLLVDDTSPAVGGDGLRITGPLTTTVFTVSSADISNTAGGTAINVFGTPAMTTFGKVTIDGTGGGAGIALIDTTGDHTFGTTTINDTMGGVGVQLTRVGGDATNLVGDITFDDGDINTTNDLTITMTGGGDAIDILDPMNTANINFAGVNIDNTAMGHGVHITGADGMINFGDMTPVTMTDLTIANTGGGNGFFVEDPMTTAQITVSTADITNTGAGDGVNITNGDGTIAFGDGDPMTNNDLNIDTMGTGDGIDIINSMATANFTFSSVDIATMGGNGVSIRGTGGGMSAQGTITFSDGVNDPMNPSLSITGTGSGNGIDIVGTGPLANITFGSTNITNTMGGHGVEIGDIGAAITTLGTLTFDDGLGTATDLTVSDTGGGDGLRIINVGGTLTFAGIDISATGAGNGVNIISNPLSFASSPVLIADGDIRDADGSAFRVEGGTQAVTYNGSISMNDEGLAVEILNRFSNGVAANSVVTFGDSALDVINSNGPMAGGISIIDDGINGNANTVIFNSTVNLGTTTRLGVGPAAVFVNHDGLDSLVDFNGPLSIATDGIIGLQVLNGGDVDIASGSIDTTGVGATGVDIDGSANAVDMNVNLTSINVSGIGDAANGLQFNNTTGVFNVANDTIIDAAGVGLGTGIDVTGGTADFAFGNDQFDELRITGATPAAININGLAAGGNFTVRGDTNLANDGVGGAMMHGINIDGGAPVVTFGATIGEVTTITNATMDGVAIANTTGGTVTFANLQNTTSGSSALALTNNNGDVVINNGTLQTPAASTDPVIDINMGTGDLTVNNVSVTQNNSATGSLVSVMGGHSGTVTFAAGSTVTATMGDGLQFNNANGTYNFNSPVTLSGNNAGIDIEGGSGTYNFAATTISSTIGDNAINVANTTGGSTTFASATLSNLDPAFDGIRLVNNDGNFVLNGGMITVGGSQHGIRATQNNSNGDISVSNTIINGGNLAGGAAIDIAANNGSVFQMLIDNNTIGNGTPPFDGIVLTTGDAGTVVDATFNRNMVVSQAAGDAVRVTAGVNSVIDVNFGSVGVQANTGLFNDFNPDYFFINNGDINLGVVGVPNGGPTVVGADIADADLATELNLFGNTSNGGVPSVTRVGLNLIDAVLPATVQMP